jgi:hypothetical protein
LTEVWLATALRLRAIAQTGRAYSRDPFDRGRFVELAAIAEGLLARLVDTTPERIRDVFLPERGYPTPKVDVRAGVFRGDTILLVRERTDGRWALPGGALPPLSLGRTLPSDVVLLVAHRDAPELPTYFD